MLQKQAKFQKDSFLDNTSIKSTVYIPGKTILPIERLMHTWNDTNFTGEDRQSIIKSHCRINFNRCKNKHSSINMVEPYFMDQYNIYIMVANSIASRQLENILRV